MECSPYYFECLCLHTCHWQVHWQLGNCLLMLPRWWMCCRPCHAPQCCQRCLAALALGLACCSWWPGTAGSRFSAQCRVSSLAKPDYCYDHDFATPPSCSTLNSLLLCIFSIFCWILMWIRTPAFSAFYCGKVGAAAKSYRGAAMQFSDRWTLRDPATCWIALTVRLFLACLSELKSVDFSSQFEHFCSCRCYLPRHLMHYHWW